MNLIPKIKAVEVDGETVYVKQMSVRTRHKYLLDAKDDDNFHAKLLALSICDAEGKNLYGEADFDKFGDVPFMLADPLIKEIVILNGLNVEKKES